MRTTDDLFPPPMPPLGDKVTRKAPPPVAEQWEPTGTRGIERERSTGRLRTNIRENGGTPCS